ncbi:EAL domain-containing protein, partial [Klebsiella pneumoniae]|uniref:EAL domain-containing protein n=1 Tax=Klebsiella pneumoniae TaxID=573 RepID=UPI0022B9ECB9
LEALVRWRHPDRGLVGPSEFVPLAEEVGLIQQIDEWVLNCACEDASGWPSSVRVSVNLSTRHFVDAGPIPMVRAALAASKLAPGR